MKASRIKYYIDRSGFFAESAVILLILAALFRIIGCWGYWNDRTNGIMLLALPMCCCVLLALCIVLFGKKGFFLSTIPVLLGVVFFVFKALNFSSWEHMVLCILLYLLVAVIYTATVFGWIGTKWLLPPLFGIPFLYHIVVEDLPALNNTAEPVTFAAGMQEMSILCIMAALFCVGMGLKKRAAEVENVEAEVVEPEPEPENIQPAQIQAQPEAEEEAAAPADKEPVIEAEPAAPAAEPESENRPSIFDEPYEPVLTLDPEPWEPEEAGTAEKDHEQ